MVGSTTVLSHPLHTYLGLLAKSDRAVFSTLSEKWITWQAHASIKDLEASIKHYLVIHDQNSKPRRQHNKAKASLPQSLARREHGGNGFQ